MDLIYCSGGNPLLSQIAYEEGYLLGFRSDATMGSCTHPVSFIDVDYKSPNFQRHLEIVARYRPKYSTVPDLSEHELSTRDIERAITQAELLQPYCETVLIVPKLPCQIESLPAHIAIGYSIPSSYGGAQYPAWELVGRRVHLLGGSPRKQMQAYLHLSAIAEIMSADGNYSQLMATRYGEYWHKGKWVKHPGVAHQEKNIYQECWRLSCRNLMQTWRTVALVH